MRHQRPRLLQTLGHRRHDVADILRWRWMKQASSSYNGYATRQNSMITSPRSADVAPPPTQHQPRCMARIALKGQPERWSAADMIKRQLFESKKTRGGEQTRSQKEGSLRDHVTSTHAGPSAGHPVVLPGIVLGSDEKLNDAIAPAPCLPRRTPLEDRGASPCHDIGDAARSLANRRPEPPQESRGTSAPPTTHRSR